MNNYVGLRCFSGVVITMGETLEMTLGMQVGFSLQRHFSHIPTGKVGKAS